VERNIAYGIWRNNNTTEYRRQFINLRRKLTNLVRQAKRWYMYRFLNPSLPSEVLWKNHESIGVKDSVEADIMYSPAVSVPISLSCPNLSWNWDRVYGVFCLLCEELSLMLNLRK
jgi:hypothetical protein